MSWTDAELVQRCIRGNTEAYGELVERYQDAVYATAYYYVGRYGVAEDVAQDAFLAAYRSLPHLNDPSRFGAWLREVASRTAANWLRRNGSRIQNETPLPHRRMVDFDDPRITPRGSAERAEQFDKIQDAINALPEHYRLPIVLRYLQELSYEEIARYMGVSQSEVRGTLHRAGKMLRHNLIATQTDREERRA